VGTNERIIDIQASDKEWHLLYEWVLRRTPAVARKNNHNPWIKRDEPLDIEEKRSYLASIMEVFGVNI